MFFLEKKKNNIIKVEKINRSPIGKINSFSYPQDTDAVGVLLIQKNI
jgi:hypothetical protein